MKKFLKLAILTLALIGLSMISTESVAQCPMCRSAVESAMMEEGNTVGVGLNKGILYLLATPYLIVLVIGGLWYKKYRARS